MNKIFSQISNDFFGFWSFNIHSVDSQVKVNPETIRQKMQWFADAKLGIFIHTGIYSVKGVDESWSFHNKKIIPSGIYVSTQRIYPKKLRSCFLG